MWCAVQARETSIASFLQTYVAAWHLTSAECMDSELEEQDSGSYFSTIEIGGTIDVSR